MIFSLLEARMTT